MKCPSTVPTPPLNAFLPVQRKHLLMMRGMSSTIWRAVVLKRNNNLLGVNGLCKALTLNGFIPCHHKMVTQDEPVGVFARSGWTVLIFFVNWWFWSGSVNGESVQKRLLVGPGRFVGFLPWGRETHQWTIGKWHSIFLRTFVCQRWFLILFVKGVFFFLPCFTIFHHHLGIIFSNHQTSKSKRIISKLIASWNLHFTQQDLIPPPKNEE